MKKLAAIFAISFLLSCAQNEKAADPKKSEPPLPTKDTALQSFSWIEQLKEFRTAVYEGNRNKVKTFFSFPVSLEQNELWYLVGEENSGDLSRPFTEKDFDRHYNKIFPPGFVRSLLKIKSAELAKSGSSETEVWKEDSTSGSLIAALDTAEQVLVLNMAYTTRYGGEEEESEHNVIYRFQILSDGRLRFKQVNLAG